LNRVVLDASAALHLVTRSTSSRPIAEVLLSAGVVLAPRPFCSETANALWKYVNFGEMSKETAIIRLEEALSLVDSFEQDELLAVEALSASVATGHTVYDLSYAVLARRYSALLVTRDKKLAALATSLAVDCLFPE
jgi:predicted nucleic acid-binding protein